MQLHLLMQSVWVSSHVYTFQMLIQILYVTVEEKLLHFKEGMNVELLKKHMVSETSVTAHDSLVCAL